MKDEKQDMRKKIGRTALALAVTVCAVLLMRWTIGAAVTHVVQGTSDGGVPTASLVPAPREYDLAKLIPEELRTNVAGLAVRRRRERLHMAYSLAVKVMEERANAAGWERLDDENALTIGNLSGMSRTYRTPTGAIIQRELRPIKGDDVLFEDFEIPVDLIPAPSEQTTPDELARRAAALVKDLMPCVVREVMVGSPMLTLLIERGAGAAFIVRSVANEGAAEVERRIKDAARSAHWRPAEGGGFVKSNLTFNFEAVPRETGGCDVNYRFSDDEVCIPASGGEDNLTMKGTTNEN